MIYVESRDVGTSEEQRRDPGGCSKFSIIQGIQNTPEKVVERHASNLIGYYGILCRRDTRRAQIQSPAGAMRVGEATRNSQAIELYEEYYEFLLALAFSKYDLPHHEAEPLVHDVFVNFLASRRPIEQARAYLVVGLCRACGEYWRKRRRELPIQAEHLERPENLDVEDSLVTRLTIQAALRQLREKCRQTLRLYIVEGHTAKEVAVEIGTTRRYAEKLIRTCLAKLRTIYHDLSERRP